MTFGTLLSIFAVSFPLLLAFLLVSFWLFDRLLLIAISEARTEWEANNYPSGYFWKPEGARPLSLRERGRIWSHWFVYRPSWTRGQVSARRMYFLFRGFGLLSMLAYLPVFFTVVSFAVLSVLGSLMP